MNPSENNGTLWPGRRRAQAQNSSIYFPGSFEDPRTFGPTANAAAHLHPRGSAHGQFSNPLPRRRVDPRLRENQTRSSFPPHLVSATNPADGQLDMRSATSQRTVNPMQLHANYTQLRSATQDYQSFQAAQAPFVGHGFHQSHSAFAPNAVEHTDVPYNPLRPQLPLDETFTLSGPVVHEGFVPAPGHENDDEFDASYRNSLFQRVRAEESSEDDEEELEAREERLMREIERKNDNPEIDQDYSISDADDLEDDLEEMLPEEDLDDEEEVDSRQSRPGHRGARGRGRGRGRASTRVRVNFGGTSSNRGGKQNTSRKRGKEKGKRGPRSTADPGFQFKDLQRRANDAYLAKNYLSAIDIINEAIQLNPEIFAAHSLLAEIYHDMGEDQKEIEALIVGAPTKRDKDLWFHIIDRIRAIDNRKYPKYDGPTKTSLVLECLRQILQLDADNYDARQQKLEIEAQLNNFSRAVKLCRKMLTMRPYDDEVLKMMARLGTSSQKQTRIHLQRMITTFETSIAYFLSHSEPATSHFDWSLLNVYLDLLDKSGDHLYGLSQLKVLSRWIQGRKAETFWDDQMDDREFDIEDAPRRIAVSDFVRSSHTAKNGYMLPIEIRVKMGLFRLKKEPSELMEALHHFDVLEPEERGTYALLFDYPDLFREIAGALHIAGHDHLALRFYEPVFEDVFQELKMKDLIGMHSCYRSLGMADKENTLMPVLEHWDPETFDELAVLAKFLEDNGMDESAFKRAEILYRNGRAHLLRKIGYAGLPELQEYLFQERRKARGNYGARKGRARKYIRHLKIATNDADESGDEARGPDSLPSLGPMTQRPEPGLFRARRPIPQRRPRTFLPDAIPGTNVPNDAISQNLFKRKLNSLASEFPEDLKAARAQHREIVASFNRLGELSDGVKNYEENATSEFISIARELIEEFSTFDLFYYDRRHEFTGYFRPKIDGDIWKESALMVLAVAANGVEDGNEEIEILQKPDKAPEHFYGIHFDKWLDAFGQYAILMARRGDPERCYSTLEVANQSNVFTRKPYQHSLHVSQLACALFLQDSRKACSAIRWLMRTYPFSTDLFRIYGSVNRLCPVSEGFSTGASLKFLMRCIKTMDYAILSAEERTNFNFRGSDQASWTKNAISTDFVDFVKDHDPALLALCGHVLTCGGGYLAALNCYFRAYALIPDDPLLNLSIGIAYIQHAMKRLSENRQFQIQQGLSFVYKYYDMRVRGRSTAHHAEAEFNVGRVWHSLGLTSEALSYYRRCVEVGKKGGNEVHVGTESQTSRLEEFTTEAAYAIQNIYALSGNFEGARKITEYALVIE